jgi:hypothetical protein
MFRETPEEVIFADDSGHYRVSARKLFRAYRDLKGLTVLAFSHVRHQGRINGAMNTTPFAGLTTDNVVNLPSVGLSVPSQEPTIIVPDVARVQTVIEAHFPGLWPAVDLGLSVCATLLLADNTNPVAVIYVGGPSSSKTTVADMFADHGLTYVSDNFTPAAFVSHAANVSRGELANVDLLPRIRHKVLITPELAPIFRGKEDELAKRFALITRVLDGQGLQTDSGTHGQRGYRGDYLFAWLGCTTPFEGKVWRVMAQLGSRLFFLGMDSPAELTVDDLVDADEEVSYKERLKQCKGVIHQCLTALQKVKVRGVSWTSAQDPRPIREWIARLAKLLAAMRSEPVGESELAWDGAEYTPAKPEQPRRAHAVLRNLARGHALVHGRPQLTEEDLPLIARVTVSSMPTACARVFIAAVGRPELTVGQAQQALGVSPETARKVMRELDRRGVMAYHEAGIGHAALWRFRPQWEWCASPEFQAILCGEVSDRDIEREAA